MSNTSAIGNYIIDQILDVQDITQQQLAEELGVSRQTVNGLITGKRNLSDALALTLAQYTNKSPQFWIDLANKNRSTLKLLDRWKNVGQHTLVDHEIITAHEEGVLGISNFSKASVQPASYDLRIRAAIVRNNGLKESNDLKNSDEPLILPPGATAVIQTIEEFTFPEFLLGKLGGMASIAAKGLVPNIGHQVDPGFKGSLQAVLINVGTEEFKISYGIKFLSLEIIFLPVIPAKPWPEKRRKGFSDDAINLIKNRKNDDEVENALNIIRSALGRIDR